MTQNELSDHCPPNKREKTMTERWTDDCLDRLVIASSFQNTTPATRLVAGVGCLRLNLVAIQNKDSLRYIDPSGFV